jgi:NADP-dependent 3-hydroxy acid dehydrogenase YdfG
LKRAIVTDATSWIGGAVARRLAAQNMTVILTGRSDDRLAMARRRIEAAAPQGL